MRIPSRAEVDAFCGSPGTRWQRVLGFAAPALLLGSIVFVLIRWPHLPAQIPMHFNARGEVDGWGGRASLLIMPLIGLVMDAVLALSMRFPKTWNAGVRITLYNRARIYRILRDMMAETRLGMAILFAGFAVYQSLLPEHFSGNIVGILLLPTLIPLVRYFIRLAKK